jgi:hypothetical protein
MTARIAMAQLVIFCASSALSAQNSFRIEITSTWWGLGSRPEMHLAITGDGGHFVADGQKVNPAAVKELLNAMDAPPIEHPSLATCGVDRAWLEDNYARGLEEFTHRKLKDLSEEQIDLFKTQFVGQESAETAFKALFENGHTDDFPKLSIAVNDGQREFGVMSDSQYPFMLPWAGIDRARGGHSCRISRAIFALLPKGFTNKDRMAVGHGLRWQLTEQIMDRIRPEWAALDAQHLVGSDIAPILARFSPLKSEVSNLSSIDLDGRQSWNAELGSKELPQNLIIGVSLLYRRNRLDGVDSLLHQVPNYTALVLSVPWLQAYLRDKPLSKIEMRYVNGRSLSTKASQGLAEDLRSHGKSGLAQMVERDAMSSAFLEVNDGAGCWSRAVVFPNRDVLLWHFKCDSVFGLSATQFKVWDFYGWRSTGTVIGPDGSIHD